MSDNEQNNETRETVSDIVKELRRQSNSENKLATQLRKTDDDVDFALASCYAEDAKYLSKIADRIEAAWARESKAIATENAVLPAVCITKQQGNAAAMHEALVAIRNALLLDSGTGPTTPFHVEVDRLTQSALSAAPRQCDVGTAEEQAERFAKYCDRFHRCTGCPCCGKVKYNRCEYFWAQMPYEAEEGAGE